jgi:cell division protein FtsX
MTSFDDPKYLPTERDSAFRSAAAMTRAQPSVVVVTVLAASLILALATMVWMAERSVAGGLRRLAESIKISVAVNPQASRKDVDDLSGRIRSTPFVGGALLRTKEEALSQLEKEALPGLREAANPLPDVWIVTLNKTAFVNTDSSILTAFSNSRDVLAAMPNVDSVTLDMRWIGTVERWRKALIVHRMFLFLAVGGATGMLLLLLFFLSARAFRNHSESTVRALALVEAFVLIVSFVISSAIAWMCEYAIVSVIDERWKLYFDSASLIDVRPILVALVGASLMAFAGTLLSVSRR